MTLLILALAHIADVWIGGTLVQVELLGCDFPDRLWVVPLALLNEVAAVDGLRIVLR